MNKYEWKPSMENDIEIVETDDNEDDVRDLSPRQVFRHLHDIAGSNQHLHRKEAFKGLLELLESGDIHTDDLKIRQLRSYLQKYQAGRIDDLQLLCQIIWYMDLFAYKMIDVVLTKQVAEIVDQIETEAGELSQKSIVASIDFTEIPAGNQAMGGQDDFELFARDFLKAQGYVIESGPGRGPDGGRDLIVIETVPGIEIDYEIRWLVSCKHHAHSGKSVGRNEEPDIPSRLLVANCDGFMMFYSTSPSQSLVTKLDGLKGRDQPPIWLCRYDKGSIANHLLSDERLSTVFQHYFPRSYKVQQKPEIERQYNLAKAAIDGEQKMRVLNAAAIQDATLLARAKREHAIKDAQLKQKRLLQLKALGEEE